MIKVKCPKCGGTLYGVTGIAKRNKISVGGGVRNGHTCIDVKCPKCKEIIETRVVE